MEEKQNIEKRSLDVLGTKPKVLVLIDSNAIIHRAYHALPKNMSTSRGELTNAVYGYATTLIKVLEDLHPTHIAASFDIGKATERLAQYSEYKATRVAADQELYDQIPKVKELLKVLKIPVYTCEGHEADDCIGTISDMFEERNSNQKYTDFKVYIITGDKDAFQLVDGNIFIYWLKRGLSEAGVVNRKVIEIEWGLQPEDFIDLKALAGDPSDNIPGVPGIGPKTAIDLLQKFDTLVKLYESIANKITSFSPDLAKVVISNGSEKSPEASDHEISRLNELMARNDILKIVSQDLGVKERILKLLIQYKDQAFLSQQLATINRNVPIDFNLEDCEWGKYDREELKEFFERMQFHSLLRRFGAERGEEPKTKEAQKQKEKDEQLRLL